MKKLLLSALNIIFISFFTALFLLLFLYVGRTFLLQNFMNQTSQSSGGMINTSTSTSTSPALSFDEALSTYENVATRAIEASERALNIMMAVFSAFMGLAAVATGLAVYLYKTANEATRQAQSAQESAQLAKTAADNANVKLNNLSDKYIELNQSYINLLQQANELRAKTYSLDAALLAGDRGEITNDRLLESQQWHSWSKWISQGSDLGRQELAEHALSGSGLLPQIRIAIEMELGRLRGKSDLTSAEKKRRLHLISMLEMKPKDI